jgi:hypothetical protein
MAPAEPRGLDSGELGVRHARHVDVEDRLLDRSALEALVRARDRGSGFVMASRLVAATARSMEFEQETSIAAATVRNKSCRRPCSRRR